MDKPVQLAPCYANGEPYRPPRGRCYDRCDVPASARIDPGSMSWPEWWGQIQDEMKIRGYRKASLIFYRLVLRRLARFCGCRPGDVTRDVLADFIPFSGRGRATTWHWTGMITSVLRTVFDTCPS